MNESKLTLVSVSLSLAQTEGMLLPTSCAAWTVGKNAVWSSCLPIVLSDDMNIEFVTPLGFNMSDDMNAEFVTPSSGFEHLIYLKVTTA